MRILLKKFGMFFDRMEIDFNLLSYRSEKFGINKILNRDLNKFLNFFNFKSK